MLFVAVIFSHLAYGCVIYVAYQCTSSLSFFIVQYAQ